VGAADLALALLVLLLVGAVVVLEVEEGVCAAGQRGRASERAPCAPSNMRSKRARSSRSLPYIAGGMSECLVGCGC
jgi:hypothetical protein